MSIRIKLKDNPAKTDYYTNLDMIEGEVELDLKSADTIAAVTVKIEGVTKSTCYTQPNHGKSRSRTPIVEQHKVLYLSEIVFPTQQLRQQSSAKDFTLPAGLHKWPFRFQIPINNDCRADTKAVPARTKLGALLNERLSGTLDYSSSALHHVQQILPPSMQGNEEIWVRYYVKATAKRASMLVINHRAYRPFIFLPIEKPMAEPGTGNAFFVKRQHTLTHFPDAQTRKSGFFTSLKGKKMEPGDTIAIEIRMPNPPAVVPGVPVPMELYGFRETNRFPRANLRVVGVECVLLVTTKVQAGSLRRNIGGRLPCFSMPCNLAFGSFRPDNLPCCEMRFIDAPKPFVVSNEIAPTFATCNLARVYELQIDVTVDSDGRTETIPLVMPLEVKSGVEAPPPQDNDVVVPPQAMRRPSGGLDVVSGTSANGIASSSSNDKRSGVATAGASKVVVVDDLPTYNEATRIGAGASSSSSTGNTPRLPVRSAGVGQNGVASSSSTATTAAVLAEHASEADDAHTPLPPHQQQQGQRPLTANLTLRRANRNRRTSYRVGDDYMHETEQWANSESHV